MPCCVFSGKVSGSEQFVSWLYPLPIPYNLCCCGVFCYAWRHSELGLVLGGLSENTHPLVSMGDWAQGNKVSGCPHPLHEMVWYLHAICAHLPGMLLIASVFRDYLFQCQCYRNSSHAILFRKWQWEKFCTFQYRCKLKKHNIFIPQWADFADLGLKI